MKPLVLFIGPTLGMRYLFKALAEAGFEVVSFNERRARDAQEFAKTRGAEIRVIIANLDKPLNMLHREETDEGRHPLVVTYRNCLFFCRESTLSILTTPAPNLDLKDFGELGSFPQPCEFICLTDQGPEEFAAHVIDRCPAAPEAIEAS